jgi:hypothetical protein
MKQTKDWLKRLNPTLANGIKLKGAMEKKNGIWVDLDSI